MKVNEMLSVLFYLNGAKRTKDGLITLYVRITINGQRREFASVKRMLPEHWTAQEHSARECPVPSLGSFFSRFKSL